MGWQFYFRDIMKKYKILKFWALYYMGILMLLPFSQAIPSPQTRAVFISLMFSCISFMFYFIYLSFRLKRESMDIIPWYIILLSGFSSSGVSCWLLGFNHFSNDILYFICWLFPIFICAEITAGFTRKRILKKEQQKPPNPVPQARREE
jgi:hypothetical protein